VVAFGEDSINSLCKSTIFISHLSTSVMGTEPNFHSVVLILPAWMVLLALSLSGHSFHKRKGLLEIFKLKLLVERIVFCLPHTPILSRAGIIGEMRISDFNYNLPEASIALYPPKVRGTSRLLVLNRQTGSIEHQRYPDLVDYVQAGDVVVLNNTRVIKARLQAVNNKNQPRELLLLEKHQDESKHRQKVLYRGKLTPGEYLEVADKQIRIEHIIGDGLAIVTSDSDLLELAAKHGSVPLPPYLKREADESDTKRYQTEFAKQNGSVAAPTASLNFTNELAEKLKAKGVKIVYLTLHVGLGTFLPIRSDKVEAHTMHSEYFEIPAETIKAIQAAKASGKKVIAIGTTVARTLEYAASQYPSILARHLERNEVESKDLVRNKRDLSTSLEMTSRNDRTVSGEANIFIYPGYKFKVVDELLTNFHAPRSTVLMLASAFAGWDNLKNAYEEAVAQDYQFLSYGDSMLIV